MFILFMLYFCNSKSNIAFTSKVVGIKHKKRCILAEYIFFMLYRIGLTYLTTWFYFVQCCRYAE